MLVQEEEKKSSDTDDVKVGHTSQIKSKQRDEERKKEKTSGKES